ncbi:hypothetical protein E2C01_077788 [Portunus trituberculatus]|uniref:Uncharacterized protein n=1 Tax=Portunus trituberculatus TaxID=210409 RepID=A0A5B7IMY2_PORTR|nr:hypothetical protein [Portunus trituberculatus]
MEYQRASLEAEKEGNEEEPVRGLDIKTLRECFGGIEKALKTLNSEGTAPKFCQEYQSGS